MKLFLMITFVPAFFFAAQLNAQSIRLDIVGSGNASFKSEMEQREKFNSLLYARMNGQWSYAGGNGVGPAGLTYFHEAGPGRFFIGGRYQGYNYSASHTDVSVFTVHMANVAEYKLSIVDAEIGYEIKSGSVTVTPKLGRRGYNKSYSNSSLELAYYVASNSSSYSGDTAGLYAGLGLEVALTDRVALVLDGIASAGPMKGSAEMTHTLFGSYLGQNRLDVSSQSMDMEVAFTSARAGFKMLAVDGLSIVVGVQSDEFKTGYPNQFTIGFESNELTGNSGFYTSSLASTLVYNPIMWEKNYSDTRTGIYAGITMDFDL